MRRSEEAGSFPPALGLSSFLWDYMGRERGGGRRAGVGKYFWGLGLNCPCSVAAKDRRSREEE